MLDFRIDRRRDRQTDWNQLPKHITVYAVDANVLSGLQMTFYQIHHAIVNGHSGRKGRRQCRTMRHKIRCIAFP